MTWPDAQILKAALLASPDFLTPEAIRNAQSTSHRLPPSLVQPEKTVSASEDPVMSSSPIYSMPVMDAGTTPLAQKDRAAKVRASWTRAGFSSSGNGITIMKRPSVKPASAITVFERSFSNSIDHLAVIIDAVSIRLELLRSK